jgi:tRNA G37 N-methylase Trm5
MQEKKGMLYCFDIQEKALMATKDRLIQNGFNDRVNYVFGSHEIFPECIELNSVSCITYNLGYLPGSTKNITTKPESTFTSIRNSLKLLKPEGLCSVVAYRGHDGGKEEAESVNSLIEQLDAKHFRVYTHTLHNSKTAPIQFSIYKTSTGV